MTATADRPTAGPELGLAYQRCINPRCGATLAVDRAVFACPDCGDLLDVVYDWDRLPVPRPPERLRGQVVATASTRSASRASGGSASSCRSPRPSRSSRSARARRSCRTPTRSASTSASTPGSLLLQYEGMNPSGSFKDNGMTAAFTHARMVGAGRVACASTGNTSAALAVYCSATDFGFQAIIFIGSGKIAYGKLAQALDHGALTIQIVGDFDDAMQRVREVADRLGIYLMNSINPFRLEGQKTIMYRVLEGLGWEVPDWIVVPGGNLGNSSGLRQGVHRAEAPGADRPRAAAGGHQRRRRPDARRSSSASTASPGTSGLPDETISRALLRPARRRSTLKASTIASAIEINRPVNLKKCLRALDFCDGVVRAGHRPGDHGRQGPGRRRRAWAASPPAPRASPGRSGSARRASSPRATGSSAS